MGMCIVRPVVVSRARRRPVGKSYAAGAYSSL